MVDICPFKAQERMNDVCKSNHFSPRTKQSYTKLSKLEDTNKKGCPRFPEQPLLFSFYTSVLIFNSTYTYAVPIRFGKHVTYALTFGSDTGSVNLVFIDQDSLDSFRTCGSYSSIDFHTSFRRSVSFDNHF